LAKGCERLNIAHQHEDKYKYWPFILQCLYILCRGLASVAWRNIRLIANEKNFTTWYVMGHAGYIRKDEGMQNHS